MNSTVDSTETEIAPNRPAARKPHAAKPKREKRAIPTKWVVGFIAGVLALAWGISFARHAYYYEETDDAYLAGHIHQVSAQVEGRVEEVLASDNQQVKAGDVLVKLDPLEYQIALQKAQAGVGQAQAQEAEAAAQASNADAQVAQAQAKIAQAEAQVRQAQAERDLAETMYTRNMQLFDSNKGAVSKTEIDTRHGTLEMRAADLDAAKAGLTAAQTGEAAAKSARESALAQEKAAQAMVATSEAEVREAQRKLDRTIIVAPADGQVGNKNVETGNRVQAGETLLALVEPDMWVLANFKETQLTRMQPGQKVEITIDAMPGRTFEGRVDSLSPATGAEFALLPPDNATGNFTKVVQRTPVKIDFDAKTALEIGKSLRPGLSVVANVRVR